MADMKAMKLLKPGEPVIVDVSVPERKSGQALIAVKAMGICGSDVSAYKGANPLVRYPLVLGHELAGVILEIDENAKGLKAGDRVVVDPYIYCGVCYPCSLGRTNCCTNLRVLGTQIDGGMQEFLLHPDSLLHRMPDGMTWEQAPLAETLSISLHSVRRAVLASGEHAAIFGAGPIGLMAALLAIDMGARPILIDIVASRLEKARRLGVQMLIDASTEDVARRVAEMTDGRLAEVVIEASGASEAITMTLQAVSHAGRLVLTGWPRQSTELNTALITRKELDVRGSRTANREFPDSLRHIAEGTIDTATILTETCSFHALPEMLAAMAHHPEKYLKVVALLD